MLINKYFLFLNIFCGFVFSCQHEIITADNGGKSHESVKDQVFNQEIYQQKITVHIFSGAHAQKMTFDGALKKSDFQLSLYAFGPFGTTLFKLQDSSGHIEYTANVKELKDKREFILKLYPAIKKIFLLKTADAEFISKKFKMQLEEPLSIVNVTLSKINSKNKDLVDLISVQKENYFEFIIENINDNLNEKTNEDTDRH